MLNINFMYSPTLFPPSVLIRPVIGSFPWYPKSLTKGITPYWNRMLLSLVFWMYAALSRVELPLTWVCKCLWSSSRKVS